MKVTTALVMSAVVILCFLDVAQSASVGEESGFYFVDRNAAAISFNPQGTQKTIPVQYSSVFYPSYIAIDEGKWMMVNEKDDVVSRKHKGSKCSVVVYFNSLSD